MNTCHVCGVTAEHPHYQPAERMFGWGDHFDYFQCLDCGCLQIAAPPDDLARYYPPDYYSLSQPPRPRPGRFARRLNFHRLNHRLTGADSAWERLSWRFAALPLDVVKAVPYLAPLPEIRRDSRFLDVGCGEHSGWLETLASCDCAALTGLDPYLTRPGTRDGISYLNTPLDALHAEFDVISFHHSLEHLADQHMSLQQAHRLLAPGGVCLIRIPLVDSAVWEQYGLDWVELDAPRHLYLHTRKSLALIADKTGFDVMHSFDDSTEFEFAGSEQYRAGVALTAPESFWIDPDGGFFSETQMRAFRARADQVNAAGRGGRAAFYLKKRPAAQRASAQS